MWKGIVLSSVLGFSALTAFGQAENLFRSANLHIACEDGVSAVAKEADQAPYLLVSSLPSSSTPAIYFGSVKVTPGKTYTYFIKGIKKSTSRINLYITGEERNILWPGGSFENGLARSTFAVPDSVSEITLAFAFAYPEIADAVEVHNIGLFEGELFSWPNGVAAINFESINNQKNLLSPAVLNIRCDDGVVASLKTVHDRNYLHVRSAPSKRDPSVYVATVKVTPGMDYTYILKAKKETSGRLLLYVTCPSGNLVWPGSELKNGIARNSFKVPKDVNEITLAVAFMSPEKTESALLEDIGLFSGYLSEWRSEDEPMDFAYPFLDNSRIRIWVLVFSFIILIVIFLYYHRLTRRPIEQQ